MHCSGPEAVGIGGFDEFGPEGKPLFIHVNIVQTDTPAPRLDSECGR